MRPVTRLFTTAFLACLAACPPSQGGGGTVLPDGGVLLPDGGTLLPDGGPAGPVPRLGSLQVLATGREGQDLTVLAAGTDQEGDVEGLAITLLDGAGAEVAAFPNHPGQGPGRGRALWPFDSSLDGKRSFMDAGATLPGSELGLSQVSKVRAALLDARGQVSSELTVDVQPQREAQLGEGCDKALITSRCVPGAGCKGTPALCVEGTAPLVSKLVFARSDAGVALLRWSGTDPDDDVAELEFSFQDASGQPIDGDLDGDGTPEASNYLHDVRGTSRGGKFTGGLEPSYTFAESVPRLAVVPRDSVGNAGSMTSVQRAWISVRSAGQGCDPLAGDLCKAGSVCYPGVPGVSSACQAVATARKRRCDSAPTLDVEKGQRLVFGLLAGASAFTPSCAADTPYPDSVVKLTVGEGVSRLVLSTDNPTTQIDTVLTVQSGPCDGPPTVLACNDDSPGVSTVGSTVELSNPAAGSYFVVIDSLDAKGGRFLLEAVAE